LDKAGADLVSLSESIDTTSATGKMVFRMLAVLAEFERDVIAERTRNAMGYKRAMGERISRFPPFGFALQDGRLIPNSTELKAVKRARSLRAKGLSFRAVAEALNREKVPCRGRSWHLATVHGILSATQLSK
jgi:site-specific DNA recombinase